MKDVLRTRERDGNISLEIAVRLSDLQSSTRSTAEDGISDIVEAKGVASERRGRACSSHIWKAVDYVVGRKKVLRSKLGGL